MGPQVPPFGSKDPPWVLQGGPWVPKGPTMGSPPGAPSPPKISLNSPLLLVVPLHTVDGMNLATSQRFYLKSRKSKNSNKNLKLYTIVHLPARIDAILKKIMLTLPAASARTHFSGAVLGSNAGFMETALEP